MKPRFRYGIVSLAALFFAMPASLNYQMHDYGFGAGGVGVGDSPTYSISGIAGEVSGPQASSTTYNMGPGLQFTRQSNTPPAPTFTNPANHYNKLQFTLATGGNPSDTVYAVAISSDSFSTTNYVQSDNTIGTNPVYQTYTAWGGGSGAFVVGLSSNTTYSMKVKAVQTKYTESAFSEVATAATVAPSLAYDLDISATDSETPPPYGVALNTLNVGSVTTATNKIWVDVTTNAESGAFVYLYSNSSGLSSASNGNIITSASGDLDSANDGFGVRVDTVSQSSGGPLAAVSPYNGSGNIVGILNSTSRNVLTTGAAPITNGRASILVKAKAATTTPSASDYATTITMIASATF